MEPVENTANIHPHLWFPKTDPPLAGGSRSGEWLFRDQRMLGTVAESLVYEVASSRVNALPSPWSRALQFEQAVLNDRYPSRRDLLQELFGCFASVALWEMFGLRLDGQRVSLTEHTSVEDEAIGPFARSLSGSLPSAERTLYSLADGSHPWEVVHVLKVDEVVVAFTSPTTLLCPAVHLPRALPGMTWTAGGHFKEPTEFLSSQQKQTLADWLIHVAEGILKAPDANSQIMANQLAKVLNDFARQLTEQPIGNPILSATSVANLPPWPRAISLLARAAKAREKAPSRATLRLGERRERPLQDTPSCPVILLDPKMPDRLNLPARDLTLYGAATLESVGCDKERLEKLYREEIKVITPDDIFLPELYLLPGEAALENSWLSRKLDGRPVIQGRPVTPLLPLHCRIRELFSSAELERQCSLELVSNAGGMKLKVSLQLPLEGDSNPYSITRIYPIKETNLIDEDLPVIALWPNLSDLSWKRYIIFSEDRSVGLSVDGFSDYELQKEYNEQEDVKYFSCERFPDLIKLNERNQYRGLIAVNPPPPPGHSASSWRVGIDFGTSFTNFFIDEGSGPVRKSLETRVIPLTLAEKENQMNLLYKFFIPETLLPKDANPPTSTALNTYGWRELPGSTPDLFHQARVQWPSSNARALLGPGIRTGFKWRQLQYQQPFLEELALLISCNAAAAGATAVEWAVSYPSAFSSNETRRYRDLWEDLCNNVADRSGLRQQILKEGGEGGLQTEALAFASYFRNYKELQMQHTACLDVGGGTTDISIWQNGSLLHQVSIPFAGHEICTKIMKSKPSFIRFLLTSQLTGDIDENENKLRHDRNFNSWLDNRLRYESDQLLLKRMRNHRSEKHQQLLAFISLMAINFGGLYHYLGLLLKALAKEGKLTKKDAMPVYIGGNGARFLNWLDESSAFSKGCDADLLLEELQRKSIMVDRSPTQGSSGTTLSNDFKNETACGLISRKNNLDLDADFDPHRKGDGLIAGEEMKINDKIFGELDRVPLVPEIDTVESFAVPKLTQLKKFAENYDEALSDLRINTLLPIRKLISMNILWPDVEREVLELCRERINKDVNDLEPEPGFIIGLRALNKTLIRSWSEKF